MHTGELLSSVWSGHPPFGELTGGYSLIKTGIHVGVKIHVRIIP